MLKKIVSVILAAVMFAQAESYILSGNSSARYLHNKINMANVDGLVDQTFGKAGKAFLPDAYQINALAIQPDGKIVVAGFYYPTNSVGHNFFYVARLLNNGELDPLFGNGGQINFTQSIAGSAVDRVYAVVVQQDQKIVIAGLSQDTNSPSSTHFAVVRLLPNGQFDENFGVIGDYTNSFFPGSVYITDLIAGGAGTDDFNESANSLVVQEDGRIVLAGYSYDADGNSRFALARFTAEGALDDSFGKTIGGTTSFFSGTCFLPTISGGDLDIINALALQADNKIVVAGLTQAATAIILPSNYPPTHFAAARFLTDGTLDITFGATAEGTISSVPGTAYISPTIGGGTINYGAGFVNESANALQIQNDGKIVLAGFTEDNAPFEVSQAMHIALARFLTDGTLDGSFGSTGAHTISSIPGTVYTYPVLTGVIEPWIYDDVLDNEAAMALSIQSDGKLVVAGNSMPLEGNCYAAARFMPDGSLDTTFGVTSAQTASAFLGTLYLYPFLGDQDNDQSYAVGIQSNGSIIVAGSTLYHATVGNSFEGSVVRLFNPQSTSSYQKMYTSLGAGVNC